MNGELTIIAYRLTQAKSPEDVFGELKGLNDEKLPNLKTIYRHLAKVTHPDVYRIQEDKSLAQLTFAQLTEWYARAEEEIKTGQYGDKGKSAYKKAIILRTKKREYGVENGMVEGEIFNLYPCRFEENGHILQATLKIVRDPQNNDLAQNETQIVSYLSGAKWAEKFSPYIPKLIDSFLYQDEKGTRQAAVFERTAGWYSLKEVHQAYPGGIDPEDMAWMWRRLLVALGFAHVNKVIHGAVLPTHIWILPDQHGLMLENWVYAALDPETSGEVLLAVDPKYKTWYPCEVFNKAIPSPRTDIHMAARCMIYLLGGDPTKGFLPDSIPKPIIAFLKSCILPGKRSCPNDAWELKEEFDDLLKRLWGERKFHPFYMK